MGKKPDPKAKAKAKAEPTPTAEELKEAEAKAEARRIWQRRKDDTKWAQSQLALLEDQKESASKGGQAWLVDSHKWHQAKLRSIIKALEEKLLDAVPDDLKSGAESYVAQASGKDVQEDSFKDGRELYKELKLEDEEYERAAASPAAISAAEEISSWTDASADGMSKFVSILKSFSDSAQAQEAGLSRIGWLFNEHKGKDPTSSEISGLNAEALYSAVEAAMRGFARDAEVQRAGCAAIRGLGGAEGQLAPICEAGAAKLLVDALRIHLKVVDVAQAGNAAFWAMSQKAGKNSPELAFMRQAGAVEALQKVMIHHAWDQTLVGRVRVTLPFLTED